MFQKIEQFFKNYGWFLLAAGFWGVLILTVQSFYQYPTSDNYFMLAHDKLIREQGFVTTEMLRMHSGFDFVVPQWLFAMFFSLCINGFGYAIGYKVAGILVFGIFLISFYFMISRLYKKSAACLIYGTLLTALVFAIFNGVRPYYITVSVLLIEVVFLEEYLKSKRKVYLIGIPILSVFLINVHNSLWVALFLVLLCYLAEFLLLSIRERVFKREFGFLLLCTGVSFLAGLINPYGMDYIFYIYHSMDSIQPLIPIIGELKSMYTQLSLPFILVTAWMVIYFLLHIRKIPIRMILLFFGFYLASVFYVRNLILFLTVGQLGMFYVLKGKDGEFRKKWYNNSKRCFLFLGITFLVMFSMTQVDFCSGRSFYQAVDKINKINKEDASNTTIFSSITDAGSYATMFGYRAYMDGCAEVYGYSNNKKFDVAKEFMKYASSLEGIEYLISKYDFDYLILLDDVEEELRDDGYRLVEHFSKDSNGEKDYDIYLYQSIR